MKRPLVQHRKGIAAFDPEGKLPHEAQIELVEEIQAAQGRPRDPQGVLLGNLLDIYDEMRRRYPDSGPKMAFREGGQLFCIVIAVIIVNGRTPECEAVV